MRNHNGQAKPNRGQGPVQLEHIEAIEKRLWNAADTLRSNSNYASNEYFMPVMGLIFLRHAYSRYLSVKDGIEYDAVNIVYKSLQEDRDNADISDIIRKLHEAIEPVIEVRPDTVRDPQKPFDISRIDFERLRREFERSKAKRTTVQNLKEAIEKRLHALLEKNPLRTDFQRHYEEIVGEYNREKDRLTIEKTFEDLLKFMQGLGEEEARHIREGLDEESLAVFDLLKKPDLGAAEVKRVKDIAVDLLSTLKAERLKIDHWREKETTRDGVRITIYDFLYSEGTGLPISSYSEAEVEIKSENVFRHVYWAYPTVPSPYYGNHV